ncbi:hypothetical protein [Christiangramia fulva]|nr:hypothetical protein [Christiangramia fulva]
MTTLESLIQEFTTVREEGHSHRRPFLNLKDSPGKYTWKNGRYFA